MTEINMNKTGRRDPCRSRDWVYRRGDIYLANLNPFKGSEQGLEQIKTIDKCRIEKYLGKMTREQMVRVEDAIRESLGMEIPECVEAP